MLRKNVVVLVLSGINLVEALEQVGLKRGNKVTHQVGIPEWIMENPDYAGACLRGLMDTDGCVYTHRHSVQGKKYLHMGLNFSSHSRPLQYGVNKILTANVIKSSIAGHGVYVYDLKGVKEYFKLIGSSNPKMTKKFNNYLILKGK
jgi:intein/homing endonuclease